VVSAFVAHAARGAVALAAFGIGLSVLVVVDAPALALAALVVTRSRTAADSGLFRYALAVGLASSAVLVALGVSQHGVDVLARLLFRAPHETAQQVRGALLGFGLAPMAVAVRRYSHGCLIHNARTRPIMYATAVRLIASCAAGAALLHVFPDAGAGDGALALTAGSAVEASLVLTCVRARARLGRGGQRIAELLPVHARLSALTLLSMLPMLITTVAVGHAASAARSLAVWPAVYGLISLFTVPLLDLDSVVAAGLRDGGTRRAARLAALSLTACFSCTVLLVAATPAGTAYLSGFIGLDHADAAYGRPWLFPLAVVPALWAVRGLLRGEVMAHDELGMLPVGAAWHLAGLALCCAALPPTGLNGVGCAALALIGGLTVEIGYFAARAFNPRPDATARQPEAAGRSAAA
jgi:hypothetical protein